MDIAPEDLSRFFADLAPELDERRRRVLCGATARLLGRGGITAVSRAAGISRNTVADVYERLMNEGLVVARQGSGTYVADLPPGWQAIRNNPKEPWVRRQRPPD